MPTPGVRAGLDFFYLGQMGEFKMLDHDGIIAESGVMTAFERLNPPVAWTGEEVERLFRLRVQLGWDWAAIACDLGRTESGVKSKFKYVLFQKTVASPTLPGQRDPIPDSVLAEQARRVVARARDLAGSVFGDPPIGFSALDKRSVA